MAVLFSGGTPSYSALHEGQRLDDSHWTTFWSRSGIECFIMLHKDRRIQNFSWITWEYANDAGHTPLLHTRQGVHRFWPRNTSARTNNAKGNPANRRSEIQSHNTVTNLRCGFIISPTTSFTPSGTTYIFVPDSNHYCLRTWNSWNPMLFLTFPYTQLYALVLLYKHYYRTQYCHFKSFTSNSRTHSKYWVFKKRRSSTRWYFYGLLTETNRITIFTIHAKMSVSKCLVRESSTGLQRETSEPGEVCWVSGCHIVLCLHPVSHRRNAHNAAIAQRNQDVQYHLQVCTLQGHLYITFWIFVLVKFLLL